MLSFTVPVGAAGGVYNKSTPANGKGTNGVATVLTWKRGTTTVGTYTANGGVGGAAATTADVTARPAVAACSYTGTAPVSPTCTNVNNSTEVAIGSTSQKTGEGGAKGTTDTPTGSDATASVLRTGANAGAGGGAGIAKDAGTIGNGGAGASGWGQISGSGTLYKSGGGGAGGSYIHQYILNENRNATKFRVYVGIAGAGGAAKVAGGAGQNSWIEVLSGSGAALQNVVVPGGGGGQLGTKTEDGQGGIVGNGTGTPAAIVNAIIKGKVGSPALNTGIGGNGGLSGQNLTIQAEQGCGGRSKLNGCNLADTVINGTSPQEFNNGTISGGGSGGGGGAISTSNALGIGAPGTKGWVLIQYE